MPETEAMHAYGYDKKACTKYSDMITRPKVPSNPNRANSIQQPSKSAQKTTAHKQDGNAQVNRPIEVSNTKATKDAQAKYRNDLAQQIADSQAAKVVRDQQESSSKNLQGLPLGQYKPVSKQEYKATLDQQRALIPPVSAGVPIPPNTQPDRTSKLSEQAGKKSQAVQEFRRGLDEQVREKTAAVKTTKAREATSLQIGTERAKVVAEIPPTCKHLNPRVRKTETTQQTAEDQRTSGPSGIKGTSGSSAARAAYKQRLDEQVRSQRDARRPSAHDAVPVSDNRMLIAGFSGMGNHKPDVAGWKIALDHQTEQKRAAQAELRMSLGKDHQNNRPVSAAVTDALTPGTTDETAAFRADLLNQIKARESYIQQQKAQNTFLEESATGLNLPGYVGKDPKIKAQLAECLRDQMKERELTRQIQHRDTHASVQSSGVGIPADTAFFEDRPDAYRKELLDQIQDNSRRRSLWQLAHLQSERNHVGLSIGDYVPYDKTMYGEILRKQIQSGSDRKHADLERIPTRESLGRYSESYTGEESEHYLKELQKDIKLRKEQQLSHRLSEQLLERNSTGLNLERRPSFDKKLLRETLLKQIADKQEQKGTSIQNLEERVARRQVEEEYLLGQLQNLHAERAIYEDSYRTSKDSSLAQELALQAASDALRKKTLAEEDRNGGCSLAIGDYKPTDKCKYGRELLEQIRANNDRLSTLKAAECVEDIDLLAQASRPRLVQVPEPVSEVPEKVLKSRDAARRSQDQARIDYQRSVTAKAAVRDWMTIDLDVIPEPDIAQLGHPLIIAKDGIADSIKHASLDRTAHEIKRRTSQIEDYEILKNILKNEQKIIQSELQIAQRIKNDFKSQV